MEEMLRRSSVFFMTRILLFIDCRLFGGILFIPLL
jgi:hypothetical protein